jgi:hypothetical protein
MARVNVLIRRREEEFTQWCLSINISDTAHPPLAERESERELAIVQCLMYRASNVSTLSHLGRSTP